MEASCIVPAQPDPKQYEAVLLASGERDLWCRRVMDAQKRGYRNGFRDGHDYGRREMEAEMAAAWHATAETIARNYVSHAELQERRTQGWGSGPGLIDWAKVRRSWGLPEDDKGYAKAKLAAEAGLRNEFARMGWLR